jgi:hypothetical protein
MSNSTRRHEPHTNWLRRLLSKESWYAEGRPRWNNLIGPDAAQDERLKRIRLLKKHGATELASVLAGCEPQNRCLSGACSECGRAFQRIFVAKAAAILLPHDCFDAVSIVGNSFRFAGNLHGLSASGFQARLSRRLKKAGATLALGGIDFSFNEYPTKNRRSRWVPQFWVLMDNTNRSRWEKHLRATYRPTSLVPRPLKIIAWDGNVAALGYALKTNFARRITTRSQRFARGRFRVCQNSNYDKLRSAERAELFIYLDEIGLEARLVLFGVEKTEGGFDVLL